MDIAENDAWLKYHEWEEACMRWRGEVLTGKFAHYCWEWDGLPVDETCKEFEVCLCFEATKGED